MCDHDAIFEQHLDLADRLARRYGFGSAVDEDLRQVARTALFLAVRRFDPDKGVFVRFASVTIVGELKKYLRDHGWAVRVPRSLQEDSITVAAATERLTARLGRSPSVGDVAEHTGFERERVIEAMRTRDARFAGSVEHLGLDVAEANSAFDAVAVTHAIDRLPEDARRLIGLAFYDGLTQAEIGRLLGVSQPQVHRRIKAATALLRHELEVADR